MKRFALPVLLTSLLGLIAPTSVHAVSSDHPHVVFIVADDLGYADIGYHGSEIKTPNLDALATRGIRFERFYALPFCTPTRAALMTGRYPFRYGLQTGAIPADGDYGLDPSELLLPEALRSAGYKTAIVGKWHLGHAEDRYRPLQRGFDVQYGPLADEIDYYTHKADGKTDWYDQQEMLEVEGYATELIGKRAVKEIEEHDPLKPLFLYLAFTAPHAPYQAIPKYEAQYTDIEDPTRRTYAAMVGCMDDQIGKVMEALERKTMLGNTLIFFMSDNGGNRNANFSGESNVSDISLPALNTPYRGGKGTLLEGGCRVIAFANWPGRIKRGVVVDSPVHVVDLMPTLLDACHADKKPAKPFDGISQWDMILGGENQRKEIVYNIEPYRAAISRDEWKLIVQPSILPRIELYNILEDPKEISNLAEQHPQTAETLRERLYLLARGATKPLFLDFAFRNNEYLQNIGDSIWTGP